MEEKEQAAIGFRIWRINKDGGLQAVAGEEYWQPGINTAGCHGSLEHTGDTIPAEKCGCGFNSFKSLPEERLIRKTNAAYIWGAAAGAGNVRDHKHSVRSAEAQIIAFYIPQNGFAVRGKEIDAVVKTYGVPLFKERDKFLDYVSKKGFLYKDNPARNFTLRKVAMAYAPRIFYPRISSKSMTAWRRYLRMILFISFIAFLLLKIMVPLMSEDAPLAITILSFILGIPLFAFVYIFLARFVNPRNLDYSYNPSNKPFWILTGVFCLLFLFLFTSSLSNHVTRETNKNANRDFLIQILETGETEDSFKENRVYVDDQKATIKKEGGKKIFRVASKPKFDFGIIPSQHLWIEAVTEEGKIQEIRCSDNWRDCPSNDFTDIELYEKEFESIPKMKKGPEEKAALIERYNSLVEKANRLGEKIIED